VYCICTRACYYSNATSTLNELCFKSDRISLTNINHQLLRQFYLHMRFVVVSHIQHSFSFKSLTSCFAGFLLLLLLLCSSPRGIHTTLLSLNSTMLRYPITVISLGIHWPYQYLWLNLQKAGIVSQATNIHTIIQQKILNPLDFHEVWHRHGPYHETFLDQNLVHSVDVPVNIFKS